MVKKRIVDRDDVIAQVDIVELARDLNLDIRRNGSCYICSCPNPTHNDTHMGNFSLQNTHGRNRFKCFACGVSGNCIDLYMLVKGVDFLTALYALADMYNIGKIIDVKGMDTNTQKLFSWEGLNANQYELFGLKTIVSEIPKGIDQQGNVISNTVKYSMKNLAMDNPKYHDYLLLNKFKEKILNICNFLNLMEDGFFLKYDLELFWMNEKWFTLVVSIIEDYKRLLYKGLMDKLKYYEIIKVNNTQKYNKKAM